MAVFHQYDVSESMIMLGITGVYYQSSPLAEITSHITCNHISPSLCFICNMLTVYDAFSLLVQVHATMLFDMSVLFGVQ